MKVPNALIRRLCYDTGYRLPKLERLEFPPKKKPLPQVTQFPHVPNRMLGVPGQQRPGTGTPSRFDYAKGNLPNDEYRFFIGYPDTQSTVCKCRWCGGVFETIAARQSHRRVECKQNLIKLYNNLKFTRTCLVCDKRTDKQSWGMLICSDQCKKEWRFNLPDYVKFAINRSQVKAGERMMQ